MKARSAVLGILVTALVILGAAAARAQVLYSAGALCQDESFAVALAASDRASAQAAFAAAVAIEKCFVNDFLVRRNRLVGTYAEHSVWEVEIFFRGIPTGMFLYGLWRLPGEGA